MFGRPHGSWCGDYNGPAGLAKGVAAYRDIPHAISAVTRVFDALRRRRLRRSLILDKIVNTNTVLSKRSRPLSRRPKYFILNRAGDAFARGRNAGWEKRWWTA
jgi:hypothetical protein